MLKIPRSITMERIIEFEKPSTIFPSVTWISAAEAAALLGIRPITVIQRIKKGSLTGKQSSDIPFTIDGKENYIVLLDDLPDKAKYAYYTSKLKEDELISIDLASPRSIFGDVWINQFINIAQLLRDVETIRRAFHGTGKVTTELKRLCSSYGISIATLYRFSGQHQSKKVSLLYTDPIYLQDKLPTTMCLWSCDLAYALYLFKDKHFSQNKIQTMLNEKRNKVYCSECPYHPNAERKGFEANIPVCKKYNQNQENSSDRESEAAIPTMIVPNNRRTVNRLLSHLPPELLLFCRRGYREWRAKYGLFSMREKPLLVGENFQGDHHVFNLFCMVKIKQYKNDKIYEKVIAVRPVLTAWMDTATGYVVGWVISVLPNSDTIAEAFCRACVPTVGDIAMGLPNSVIVDCGADYKSKLLEDPCSTFSSEKWSESDFCLNKRFSGLGILRALQCEIYHTIPYHPQSKDIERMFGTIENDSISHYEGWCYNSVEERPDGFAKELQKKLENRELLWFDEFVKKFAEEVLPAYHGKPDDPKKHPDLPGWLLSFESMSPAQRYVSLPKARKAVPDWKTMSILKRHYYPEKCLVGPYGIRFQNVIYSDDALAAIRGKYVSILCHSFTPPFAPSSVTVIYNNEAVCEALPKRKNTYTGENPRILTEDSDTHNRPAKEMKNTVSRISRIAGAILPDKITNPVLSRKDQLREVTYGQTPLEEDTSEIPDKEIITSVLSEVKDYDNLHQVLFGEM